MKRDNLTDANMDVILDEMSSLNIIVKTNSDDIVKIHEKFFDRLDNPRVLLMDDKAEVINEVVRCLINEFNIMDMKAVEEYTTVILAISNVLRRRWNEEHNNEIQ